MSPPSDAPSGAKCAICSKPLDMSEKAPARFAPFCSKRCADIDLGRWLKGGYAISGTVAEEDEKPATGSGPAPGEPPDGE